jgi:hypothetical protein
MALKNLIRANQPHLAMTANVEAFLRQYAIAAS